MKALELKIPPPVVMVVIAAGMWGMSLVTGGIYRYTRNPMYVGLVFVLVGWAAFLASLWTLVGPLACALYLQRFQIEPEERVLGERFGAAYADYAASVRRWL
jgi:protein-S-isoprenylcysteine O-methyltransferase Ste14